MRSTAANIHQTPKHHIQQEHSKTVETMANLLSPSVFSKIAHFACLGYALVSAISIGASQTILVAFLVYWVVFLISSNRANSKLNLPGFKISHLSLNKTPYLHSSPEIVLAIPIAFWFLCAWVSTLIGIDFANALAEVCKSSIYLLLPFAVSYSIERNTSTTYEILTRCQSYIFAIIFSQTIAAFNSIVDKAAPFSAEIGLPGAITESGQLVISLTLAVGLALSVITRDDSRSQLKTSTSSILTTPISFLTFSCFLFVMGILLAWPTILLNSNETLTQLLQGTCLIVLTGFFANTVFVYFKSRFWSESFDINNFSWFKRSLFVALPLMTSGLLVNLKRGPWLGVFVGLMFLGLFVSKRLIAVAMIVTVMALLFVSPIQERASQFAEHFSIYGGRSSMWLIGTELVNRFPLGLGPDNAVYMRTVDPSLPPTHRHMHNNLLNIAVEMGWIGLTSYIWWIGSAVFLGWRSWKAKPLAAKGILSISLSASLIGWQTAGLVEYNFGDGEIRLMALFSMGLILALARINSRGVK